MNTQTQNIGDLIRAHLHVTTTVNTPKRDLAAEAEQFCLQWQNLVGIPTTKSGITQMMRRALVVVGVAGREEVEVVLREVRNWYAMNQLTNLGVHYNTAVKRWKKACLIEDVILVDYI